MNPTILAIAEQLERIQQANPHLRLGQIISNAVSPVDLFFVQDDALLSKLQESTPEKREA